ncbi:unnamed protein product [Paramecium octaurelia]|uniref:Uncharacterized protein n=1 Tax=Paramecium octaurelia TaxID=43137 RepID=A0A8S1YC52_PAROT|nr:unnamed protein product [Paramecium octaurelia]
MIFLFIYFNFQETLSQFQKYIELFASLLENETILEDKTIELYGRGSKNDESRLANLNILVSQNLSRVTQRLSIFDHAYRPVLLALLSHKSSLLKINCEDQNHQQKEILITKYYAFQPCSMMDICPKYVRVILRKQSLHNKPEQVIK